MSSLDALLPDDLEKHVQLNRASECRGHAARNAKQKGSSHPGGDDPEETTQWTSVRLAKAGANKAKAKASKDSMDKDGTRARIRCNVGTVESADISRKTVGARMTTKERKT